VITIILNILRLVIIILSLNLPFLAMGNNCDRYENVNYLKPAMFYDCAKEFNGKKEVVEIPMPEGAVVYSSVAACAKALFVMSPQVVCPNGDIIKKPLNDNRSKRDLCIFNQRICYVTCPDGEEIRKPTSQAKYEACSKKPIKNAHQGVRKASIYDRTN